MYEAGQLGNNIIIIVGDDYIHSDYPLHHTLVDLEFVVGLEFQRPSLRIRFSFHFKLTDHVRNKSAPQHKLPT